MNMFGKERKEALRHLQDQLGYDFRSEKLLELAFTHSSYLNEQSHLRQSNERLEFLGDAVLELVISDLLYKKFPKESEGELSKRRIQVVCEASFHYLAEQFSIAPLLLMGRGEEKTRGREKPSVLADAFEALCGAIYLDGGMDWLYSYFSEHLQVLMQRESTAKRIFIDYKSALQQYMDREHRPFEYRLLEAEGPAHDRTFVVAFILEDRLLAKGVGKSKKEAEREAARKALEKLELQSSQPSMNIWK